MNLVSVRTFTGCYRTLIGKAPVDQSQIQDKHSNVEIFNEPFQGCGWIKTVFFFVFLFLFLFFLFFLFLFFFLGSAFVPKELFNHLERPRDIQDPPQGLEISLGTWAVFAAHCACDFFKLLTGHHPI